MKKSFFFLLLLSGLMYSISHYPSPESYIFPVLSAFPKMPVNTLNPVSKAGVELGRYLFYDPILSKDSSLSCSACHQQEFAFSDGRIRFSEGVNGGQLIRNTPAIFNLAWNEQLFWDGKANNVEGQVFFPVRDHMEMDLDWQLASQRISASIFYQNLFQAAFPEKAIDSLTIAYAIAQFERTIISYNSRLDKALRREVFLTKDELKGMELMNDQSKGNCLHCHPTDAHFVGTTGQFSNNGLDTFSLFTTLKDEGRIGVTKKKKDYGLFKIPSLRNVALTAPYMHDGRFETLEEVLDFYTSGVQKSATIDPKMHFGNPNGVNLTALEKAQIITFLKALTDSVLIEDKAFSNPF
ncbi:cytochrome-c peroxidase [Putridiphycobacter roseus]|uniref:cytochrome-c peroxidase n=1 Tax=Putridiphycobacter roseus TaxID=2219161 RepID=UPI0011B4888A|nr:cytochrome c peroxidase [Putridiphycobacter roseus]